MRTELTRWWRLCRLSLSLSRLNAGRTTALIVMIALSLTVFLGTTALARASQQQLHDAIQETTGPPSQWELTTHPTPFGVHHELQTQLLQTLRTNLPSHRVVAIEKPPNVTFGCQTDTLKAPDDIALLHDNHTHTPPTRPQETTTGLCVDGTVLPPHAFVDQPKDLPQELDSTTLLHPQHGPLLRAQSNKQTTGQSTWTYYIWSTDPNTTQHTEQKIVAACEQVLRPHMEPTTPTNNQNRACNPTNKSPTENLREAGRGTAIMFDVLGWSVLVLGGLGLLIAEHIIIRDRRWLFGLSRSFGARPSDIAVLVLLEVLLVLTCGSGLALLVGQLGQNMLNDLSFGLFGRAATMSSPDALLNLIGGAAAILVVACSVPVTTAITADPLDVIEAT